MKKILLSITVIVVAVVLAACGGKGQAGDDEPLLIGTTGGPYVYLLKKAIIPALEEEGYNVGIIEYTDHDEMNNALYNDDINVNLFQHDAFLKNFTEEHTVELSELSKVPTEPTGVYSTHYSSLDDIEEGATITIPNDQVNIATALDMLQKIGLVKLDPAVEASKVTEENIIANPKNLSIQPILLNQLPIAIHSAELTVVPGNFALHADMDFKDALAIEEVPEQFQNIIAVKSKDLDKQFAQDIVKVIESEQFKEIMKTNIYHVKKEK